MVTDILLMNMLDAALLLSRTKKIERTAFVPFDRYGSRASKNGRMSFQSTRGPRKKIDFCLILYGDFGLIF